MAPRQVSGTLSDGPNVILFFDLVGSRGEPVYLPTVDGSNLVLPLETVADGNGDWQIELPSNEDIEPVGTVWVLHARDRVVPSYFKLSAGPEPVAVTTVIIDGPAPPAGHSPLQLHEQETVGAHGIPDLLPPGPPGKDGKDGKDGLDGQDGQGRDGQPGVPNVAISEGAVDIGPIPGLGNVGVKVTFMAPMPDATYTPTMSLVAPAQLLGMLRIDGVIGRTPDDCIVSVTNTSPQQSGPGVMLHVVAVKRTAV